MNGHLSKCLCAGILITVSLWLLTGCTANFKRDFARPVYQPTEHFRVQFVVPEPLYADQPIPIRSLLILPPFGVEDADQQRVLFLSMWQELQQLLPGVVRAPRSGGGFAPYVVQDNLLMDDGRLNQVEVQRLGLLTGASHLLMVRMIDYRPYHPQRIIMEWELLDVMQQRSVLVLAGALDASEQQVLQAAGRYHRNRGSSAADAGSLDMMLRSPREYSGFAVAQAVDSLKGWLQPESDVMIPRLSF